ncbi:MAG: PilZ domain-containing protein [Phycisphaerae bacterium]
MFRDLSADQQAVLSEVLLHLDKMPPSPRANRRRAIRHGLRTTMEAILVGEEQNPRIRIFTRNISTSGIGFVSRRPFKQGEKIAFGFQCAGEERKIILAKVTFVRYVRRGMYEMGAEFTDAMRESAAPAAMQRMICPHL